MSNDAIENAREILIDLGLTEYEAKAYISILQCQPATAYEIAKACGVPTSKIYETIARLREKGLTRPTSEKKQRGQQYIALDSKQFLESKRTETVRKTEMLGPMLQSIGNRIEAEPIWQIQEKKAVIEKAGQLIRQASGNILLSLWPAELEKLKADLLDAEQRNIKIAMVHFGIPAVQIGATFYHPEEKTIYAEKGGRALTMVVDNETVLVGTFFDTGAVEAVWSKNHSFVTTTEDYIKHDVYITKVTAVMKRELQEKFGENYEIMRDVFRSDL